MFSSLNALWTVISVHLTTRLSWSLAAASAFALVGLAAALCTPLAGRLTAARGSWVVLAAGLLAAVPAVAVLGVLSALPAALVFGYLTLTVTVQGSQVAQQARIFAESPRDRSAVNTVFTAAVFAGGALGAGVGIPVHLAAGLPGAAALVGGSVLLSALGMPPPERAAASAPTPA